MTRRARDWLTNHRKELALASAASLLGLAIAELGGRLVVARERRLPLLHRGEHRFYPRLDRAMRDYDPSGRNVLLLGGSVIMRIPPETWRERLPGARFSNVAFKAHTSLDSLYKYEQLLREGYRFDVVVFYHGINEVRTNNAPPGIFRDDYSHYEFYRMAHTLFRDRDTPGSWLARNTFLGYGMALLRLDTAQDELMPPDEPEKAWKFYGGDVKSIGSFRANLVRISDLADREGSPLVVPRFAFHVPDGYSFGAWQKKTLGYSCRYRGDPTHIWGIPGNVVKGIEAHDRVIDEERARFVFVDTRDLDEVEFFCDICHFSKTGEAHFLDLVTTAIREQLS